MSQNRVVIPPRIFFANAKDTLSGGWRNLGQSHWGPFFAKERDFFLSQWNEYNPVGEGGGAHWAKMS